MTSVSKGLVGLAVCAAVFSSGSRAMSSAAQTLPASRVTLLRVPDGGIQPQVAVDPDGGMHLGREGFRRHVESYLDAWSDASVEVDARAVGEQVVGRIRYTGAGRATGIEVETPEYGALYDFRAGRIRRVRQFATYADALEAAGLSE